MLLLTRSWWQRNWTIVCAGFVLLCNIELVVMPVLIFFTDIRGMAFFCITACCATLELCFYYRVPLARFKELAQTKIVSPLRRKPAIDALIDEFLERGFDAAAALIIDWTRDLANQLGVWISGHLHEQVGEEQASKSRVFQWLIRGVRIGGYLFGYPAVFFLGAMTIPIPVIATIPWASALVFCRSRKWDSGFLALAAGNIFKTYLYSTAILAALS